MLVGRAVSAAIGVSASVVQVACASSVSQVACSSSVSAAPAAAAPPAVGAPWSVAVEAWLGKAADGAALGLAMPVMGLARPAPVPAAAALLESGAPWKAAVEAWLVEAVDGAAIGLAVPVVRVGGASWGLEAALARPAGALEAALVWPAGAVAASAPWPDAANKARRCMTYLAATPVITMTTIIHSDAAHAEMWTNPMHSKAHMDMAPTMLQARGVLGVVSGPSSTVAACSGCCVLVLLSFLAQTRPM